MPVSLPAAPDGRSAAAGRMGTGEGRSRPARAVQATGVCTARLPELQVFSDALNLEKWLSSHDRRDAPVSRSQIVVEKRGNDTMPFFDFIEIGTSDFDTIAQSSGHHSRGLSIDPVSIYLEKLPQGADCVKLNAAISDYDGELYVYYIEPEAIAAHGLPDWIRGCSSINSLHPTASRVIREMKVPNDIVKKRKVPVYTLMSVVKKYGISGIHTLKVDTEGHDCVIINKFFDDCTIDLYPHDLFFEHNILSDNDKVHRLVARLLIEGYDIVRAQMVETGSDIHLKLNIRRLANRHRFTDEIAGYFLSKYPDGYNPDDPPHDNTLGSAMDYCKATNNGGVTYQYGRYEVREGQYLLRDAVVADLKSWVLLP
ncbi:FkbM family methyltransferase [Methylobacterium sp. JK268]